MHWSSFRAYANKFGFTESEAKAVVFIVAAVLAGALFGAVNDEENHRNVSEEYRILDSAFAALSTVADRDDANELNGRSQDASPRFADALIDINRASRNDLQALPGIGPVIAGRIIKYRDQHGGFTKLNDLMKVKSIGKKKFELLKPYICIGE